MAQSDALSRVHARMRDWNTARMSSGNCPSCPWPVL
jgi:hypothetical protein